MFSKSKNSKEIDSEQREQYEYARARIKQKKNLMRHFVFFLAGSVLFIVLDEFLNVGQEIIGNGWYIWAILIWAFFFLVHLLNVFLLNSFMGKEWEDQQIMKLKAKQAERMAELQRKIDKDFPLPKAPETFKTETNIDTSLPSDTK